MSLPSFAPALPTMAIATLIVAQELTVPSDVSMDPTLFAAAIVTVIAALGGVTVQIINSVSSARDRREAAAERKALMERTNATADKADTLVTTTAEIRELTNSTNSNLQKALELATEKNVGLERALLQAKETRKEVANRQALTDLQSSQRLPNAAPVHSTEQSLESIDENTAAIDENTKRTQADVRDLKEKPS